MSVQFRRGVRARGVIAAAPVLETGSFGSAGASPVERTANWQKGYCNRLLGGRGHTCAGSSPVFAAIQNLLIGRKAPSEGDNRGSSPCSVTEG